MSTKTIKIDGQTYQARLIPCGKAEHCKTCKEEGGHAAVYQDLGTVDGKRKWAYVGNKLPQADPTYQPAKCQREGCPNPLPATARRNAQFCSSACRQAAHRAKQQA